MSHRRDDAHVIATAEMLAPIQALYDRGLFVQALARAQASGLPALSTWRGVSGRILAGRLAGRLGALRLANAIFDRARREAPGDARARAHWLYGVWMQRGAFTAWQHLQRDPVVAPDAETRADLLLLRAGLLATFRDFTAAHQALTAAEHENRVTPWLLVQTAGVLREQDRYDQALAKAQAGLALHPHFVPAIGQAAHLLRLLGRDRDARALLHDALAHVESFEVAVALSLVHADLGEHADALAQTERALALAPLSDQGFVRWVNARRSDLHLRLGDRSTAKVHALAAGSTFHRALAERLDDAGASAERVELAVPFVRQHHMTCGPATLVALAAFFGRSIDQLQVADEICYGGTTAANTRRWALRNGFAVREFTFNASDAHALLRHGVPIAVSTAEATTGHLQAVIGFDALRGTLIVRDPFVRSTREWPTEEFLQAYRSCGPRAFVLLPQERAGDLAGLALRDDALHDDDFAIQEALGAHDRAEAMARYAHMRERDPEHMLTIQARWALSAYERDPVGTLACIERLLALFPDDARLLLHKTWCLGELEQVHERADLLRAIARQRRCDPVFLVMLADESRTAWRGATAARSLLLRALRMQPTHARAHYTYGMLAWQVDDAPVAHEHLRFAACLHDTDDSFATAYFDWCAAHAAAARGLTFLRARHEQWRRLAAGPTLVLHRALLDLHQDAEARTVLANALADRPDDGDLIVAAARDALRTGDLARCEALLQKAEGRAYETRRLAALADLADRALDHERALRCWQAILQREPLHHGARVAAFRLTEILRGRPAALAELQAAANELPFARPLRRYVAHEVGRDHPESAMALLRGIIDEDPADAWARRELALQLGAQGEISQALAAAEEACALEPGRAASHAIVGSLLARAGQVDAARARLLAALDRDLDEAPAMRDLADLASTPQARRALLEDLAARLCARGSDGRGLRAFAGIAAGCAPAADARAWLEAVWRAQPDAPAASSVLIEHLLRAGAVPEALAVAERACERFPLAERTWLDRAAVARASDPDGERAALERAARLAPASAEVAWYLASALVRAGRRDDACAVLMRCRERTRDPSVLALLAKLHADAGEPAAAVGFAKEALQLDCEFDRAWAVLHAEAQRTADPDLPVRAARELTQARPHDPRAFTALADLLHGPTQRAERLDALAKAIDLEPGNPDPYDLRAELLAESGRVDLAAAVIARFPHHPLPVNLRGRQAWLAHAAGDVERAVREMRALLAEDSFYAWGWRELLGWLHAAGSADELAAAAADYVRARPNDAVAHAWVAEACVQSGDRATAKVELERALWLHPGYAYAGDRLCALQIADGQYDEADATLTRFAPAAEPPRAALRHVQIACHKGEWERVRAHLLALCRDPAHAPWMTRAAGEALQANRHDAVARGWLRPELRLDAHAAGAAVAWMRTWTCCGAWHSAIAALHDEDLADAGFVAAATTLVDDLTASGSTHLWHRLLRGRTAARLRAFDPTWGAVAACLNADRKYGRTVRWMADWRQRPGVEPWMLVNLAYALRHRGHTARAHAVSLAAVALPAQGGATGFHRLWLAFDAAVAGDLEPARTLLPALAAADPEHRDRDLAALVAGLLAAAQSPGSGAAQAAMHRTLDGAWRAARTSGDLALRRAVRQAARAARMIVGVSAWRWRLRHLQV